MTTSTKQPDTRGLAGQTIGETQICSVGQSHLIYRGYEIADLAAHATFEEVAFLLLVGHKPSSAELDSFKAEINEYANPHPSVIELVQQIARTSPDTHPMSALRTAISAASHLDPDCEDNSPEAELRKSKRLMASIPAMIGAH
ncbi:MAG TPA: citrate synthase, partial [Phycisphaerales bacterium]|nr:citrate synthase [Phycisphaerales bacterium]